MLASNEHDQIAGQDKLSLRDVGKHVMQLEINNERKNLPFDDVLS